MRGTGDVLRPTRRALMGVFLVLAALLALVLFLLRGRLFPADPVWGRVQRTGVWRVGMDPSFPPFEMTNEAGEVVGFDVDLARALAEHWGVRVKIVGVGFDGLIDAVKANRVDAAVSAIPYDPLLTRDVRFSDPYFDAGWRVVVPKGSALQALADLAGARVAVEWGSEGDVWARRLQRRYEGMTLVLKPSLEEAIAALAAGEADAAVVDGVTYALHRQAWRQVGKALSHDPYVIVMPIEAFQLQKEVNKALKALQQEGVMDALEKRWMGGVRGNE